MEPAPEQDAAPELSASERQDLVVAARPNTQAEAIFLIDVLEEAGIPVVRNQQSLTEYTSMYIAGELRVPRVQLEKAKAEIERARTQAAEQRINLAFEPENIHETIDDPKADPVTLEMKELRDCGVSERDAKLRARIKQWIANNDTPETKIAEYLAAAGLDEQQARDMVESVASEERSEVESALATRLHIGIGLVALGLFLFGLSLTSANAESLGAMPFIRIGLVLSGLIMIFTSLESKPVSTLSGGKPREPGEKDS